MKIEEISEDQIIVLAGLGAALTAYGVAKGAAEAKDTITDGLKDIVDDTGHWIDTVVAPKNPVAVVNQGLRQVSRSVRRLF